MLKILLFLSFFVGFHHSVSAAGEAVLYENTSSVGEASDRPYSIGLITGFLNYPGVVNIDKVNLATGIEMAARLGAGFTVSGDFLYSFHSAEIDRIAETGREDIDQFMISTGVRYDWFSLIATGIQGLGLETGLILTHNRRQYNFDENASQGFDLGGQLGVRYQFNKSVALTVEYRYMQNLQYDRDRAAFSNDEQVQSLAAAGASSRIEELDYQLVLASLKYTFGL